MMWFCECGHAESDHYHSRHERFEPCLITGCTCADFTHHDDYSPPIDSQEDTHTWHEEPPTIPKSNATT